MALTPLQTVLGKSAAIIGAVQALAWWGLSLAYIIIYYSGPVEIKGELTFSKGINIYLQAYYLVHDKDTISRWRVILPTDFSIVVWMYFFLSCIWIVISTGQFITIHINNRKQSVWMICWGTITIGVSIVDLVFSSLLLRDFMNCPLTDLTCHTVIGIVMTIAARGYTLWLLNCILAISVIMAGVNIITHDKIKSGAYGVEIPRAKANPSRTSTMEHMPRHLKENNNYPQELNPNGYRLPQNFGSQTPSLGGFQNSPMSSPSPSGYPSQLRNGNRFNY